MLMHKFYKFLRKLTMMKDITDVFGNSFSNYQICELNMLNNIFFLVNKGFKKTVIIVRN